MSSACAQIQLDVKSPRGDSLGSLNIVSRTAGSLYLLSEVEASERGEEIAQLVEGHSYEYELDARDPSAHHLRETAAVQPSRISHRVGRIEPGLATGLLPIVLENANGEEVARAQVEVRTSEIDYHLDYQEMLNFIADKSINLLMNIHAPSQVRLSSDDRIESRTLHERFAFLRYLLTTREFRNAVDRVLAMPHLRSAPENLTTNIRQGIRPGRSLMSSLARGSQRVPLPTSHPVYKNMVASGIIEPSLPFRVAANRSIDSFDTPENRFIKHALNDFLSLLFDIEEHLFTNGTAADLRLVREVTPLRLVIAGYLEANLFKEVGSATVLPLGSPILQRRSGYREMLESWLKFSLAARLSWSGGEGIFGAGKKDVALLYEYWLFFVLLELIKEEFLFDSPDDFALIELTKNGFDMRLKTGSIFSVVGVYKSATRSLNARYSYNRTFSGETRSSGPYPRPGSWTRSMRPDFTLSFWPTDFTEEEAERQELIVHVHFDAKYRVESIAGLFGSENEGELDEEGKASRANVRPKRSDLLKMHAYRDAIRRTEGAYVLYPGPVSGDQSWVEYHEIVPGLGAFSIRPGNEKQAKLSLSQFLRDVLKHLTDPTTRREQQSYHVFRVQSPAEEYRSTTVIPSYDRVARRLRPVPSIEKPEI